MGAPTSSILFEFYIQHMEHNLFPPILIKYRILGYFRYVDDILIIYSAKAINIDNMLPEFNNMLPQLKFISELEEDGKI